MSQHWQKLRNALVHTPQALRLVWQANRVATVGLGFLTLGGALLPATQAWVGKLIVDGVVASIQKGNDPDQVRTVFYYLILELILFLLSTGINHSRRLIQQLIQLQLANQIRSEIIRKALTLDLAFFEHPDFYDRLQNARREGGYKPVELINDTFQIVQSMITLISFAALMLRFSPWLVLILLATSIPAFIAETRFSEQGFRLLTRRAPETRQINYLSRLLTEDTAAKEIKLFNLGSTLAEALQDSVRQVFPGGQIACGPARAGRFQFGLGRDLGILRLLRVDRLAHRSGDDFARRHDALSEHLSPGPIDLSVDSRGHRQHL